MHLHTEGFIWQIVMEGNSTGDRVSNCEHAYDTVFLNDNA